MRTQLTVDRQLRRSPHHSIVAGVLCATLTGLATTMALSGCASTRSVDSNVVRPAHVESTPPAATADVSELRPHARRRALRGS